MGKTIGSVILGYLVTVVVFFATFLIASLLMGADRSFHTGSYEISTLSSVLQLGFAFFAGTVGGRMCLAVAREKKAAWILAAAVIVIQLVMDIPTLTGSAEDPGPRTEEVSVLEALRKPQWPVWFALTSPLIIAAGVLTATRLSKKV
jgi:hypothetical protein